MPMVYETTEYEVSQAGSTALMDVGGISVLYAKGDEVCEDVPEETIGVQMDVICNPRAASGPVNMKVMPADDTDDPCTVTIQFEH